jgi:hypothetical protein
MQQETANKKKNEERRRRGWCIGWDQKMTSCAFPFSFLWPDAAGSSKSGSTSASNQAGMVSGMKFNEKEMMQASLPSLVTK